MKQGILVNSMFSISLLISVQLCTYQECIGQNEDGMLISQIDGNRYTRKNFDGNGKLKDYQTIEIGLPIFSGDKIDIKMTVTTYDTRGNIKGTTQSTLVCTPESKQVLMGVFPFAGNKSKKSLIVNMDRGAIMYPSGWRKLTELPDFNFTLNLKGGAAGFIGTKSDVSIVNRKVDYSDKKYSVSGEIALKAYAFGIKIAAIKYKYFEEIDDQKGIVYQKFTAEKGDYFTIEIESTSN